MRTCHSQLLVAIIILGGLSSSPRADTQAPRTYSYVLDPAVSIAGSAVVKVVRDGPLEAVDQILPASAGRAKEFHTRVLYDFRAHKIYSQVISDPSVPCTVMTYRSPAAPQEFDVITGWAVPMKELLARAKQLRKETVNGVSARVMEVKGDQGEQTVWVADRGGFPVKLVMRPAGKPPITMLEIKDLSFAKPPASAFTRPSGCQVVPGESTATGGHAEIGTGATARGSASKTTPKVTSVTLRPVADYSGICPARVRLTGTITVDKPGKVFYQFGAGTMEPGKTLTFTRAGTKTVTSELTFGADSGPGSRIGIGAVLHATGEDASGNPDLFIDVSKNVDFTITCTDGAVAGGRALEARSPPPTSAKPSVTAVELSVTPTRYKGACPVVVKLVGTLKADGPGTAYFQFQAGALGAGRDGTVQIGADGTATVTSEGQASQTPEVQQVRFLGGMEPRGHQENAKWVDVMLDIQCTN